MFFLASADATASVLRENHLDFSVGIAWRTSCQHLGERVHICNENIGERQLCDSCFDHQLWRR